MNLHDLPPAARATAVAVKDAVDAATSGDAEALRDVAESFTQLNPERTGTILGMMIRMLLEEQHPDGLDADDIRDVLTASIVGASPWLPEVNPDVLLVILAGALGIHPEEADGIPRPSDRDIAMHTPILVASLLSAAASRLDPYLSAALAEIARAQTMEAP